MSVQDFGYREYRIVDLHGNPVRAAGQFLYRGYEISFSTICPTPIEVAVFNGTKHVHTCHTVAQAIEWCQQQATVS